MTSLPPIDLTDALAHNQPTQRPRGRADFGTHVPQQRQANTNAKKSAQTEASRSAPESTATPPPASAPPAASTDTPRAVPDSVAATPLPAQDAAWHEAIEPVKASLAMPGLSGRIYPESLRVIGYLSMLDASNGAATKGAETDAPAQPAQAIAPPTAGTMPAVKYGIISSADAHIDPQALAEAAALAEAHEGSEPTEASGQSSATSGVQVEWLHRLIRIEGDTATLWIRDYRLDDAQKHVLATQLRDYARTSGSPVKRVMINGEELWRAGAGKDGNNERGAYVR